MVEPVVAVVGYSKIQHHVGVDQTAAAWEAWAVAWAVVVWVDLISQANGILTSLLVRYLQEAAVWVGLGALSVKSTQTG